MNTRLFLLCLKHSNYKLEQINIGKLIVFVCMFEIVNALTNSSRRIKLRNKNFASLNGVVCFHIQHVHFCFEVLFTKNYILQVSVEGF